MIIKKEWSESLLFIQCPKITPITAKETSKEVNDDDNGSSVNAIKEM